MLNDIKSKLTATLEKEVFEEKDITYSLIQMRKILEKENLRDTFPVIEFYSDWVAHSFLDRTGAKSVLKEIETHFSYDRESNMDIDVIKAVYSIVSFSKLKDEMKVLLTKYSLPDEFLKDPYWSSFLDALIGVLSDTPLKTNDGSLIKEFVFKPQMSSEDVAFEIRVSNGQIFITMTNFTYLKNNY